jgi:acetylornithine deacetylase/succinyl-diaminopimelate desuccinylase-like protein
MLLAHIDTVFPADTPLGIRREDDLLFGPSIGDNSVSVASMLTVFEMLDALGWDTAVDIVAVANVGEEGLGNLCGARAAVKRYLPSLGAVLAIDGRLGSIVNVAVGSQRWRITLNGPGGHSYGSFGTPSAIHTLARIIAAISDLTVPKDPKTTFNVGLIEGGTSVNTIAASASAVIDMRSTDVSALDHLAKQVRAIVLLHTPPESGLRATIEVLGERPAGSRSEKDPLIQLALQALHWVDIEPKLVASSTDANIPISLNIPSACVGITRGEKAHTVDEQIQIAPIEKGLAQLVRLCVDACELIARER